MCEDLSEHPWGEWSEWAIANPDRVPGTQSRWSAGKDLSFTPLRPERVVEVGYDHMEGNRFRHTAQFKRWRPDRDPESCGYEQLEEVVSYDLAEVLGGLSAPTGLRCEHERADDVRRGAAGRAAAVCRGRRPGPQPARGRGGPGPLPRAAARRGRRGPRRVRDGVDRGQRGARLARSRDGQREHPGGPARAARAGPHRLRRLRDQAQGPGRRRQRRGGQRRARSRRSPPRSPRCRPPRRSS